MDTLASRHSGASAEGSHIGKSVRLNGELEADENLTISGQFKGNIHIPKQQVVVAEKAHVDANIKASDIKIQGHVQGNVDGIQHLELTGTAEVTGKLTTREISVKEGAVFRGQVDIITDNK